MAESLAKWLRILSLGRHMESMLIWTVAVGPQLSGASKCCIANETLLLKREESCLQVAQTTSSTA